MKKKGKNSRPIEERLKLIRSQINITEEDHIFKQLDTLCKSFVSYNSSSFTLVITEAAFGFKSKTANREYMKLVEQYSREVITFDAKAPEKPDSNPLSPFGGKIKFLYFQDLSREKGKLKEIYHKFKYESLLILPIRSSFTFAMRDHVLFDNINDIALFNSKQKNAFSDKDIEILFTLCTSFYYNLSLSRLTKTLGSYFLSSVYNSPLGMVIIAKDDSVIVCNDSAFSLLNLEHKRKKRRRNGKLRMNFFNNIEEVFPNAGPDGILKAIQGIRSEKKEKVKLQFWHKVSNKHDRILIRMLVYRFIQHRELPGGGGNLEITIAFDDFTNEYKQNQLQKELEIARNVQLSFLPDSNFSNDKLETYGISFPAKEVGGDYYDYIPSNNSLNIAIADVSGKGISAAMVMSSLKISLQNLIETRVNFGNIASHLNDLIYRNTPDEVFITMFLGRINLANRELIYVNSGHNPPILRQKDGKLRFLTSGGVVLGAFPNQKYEIGKIKLQKNDILLCYTDGITDSENIRGVQFEEKRLIRTIKDITPSVFSKRNTTHNLIESIVGEVNGFRGEAQQVDDITMFALKVKK